MVMNRMQTSIEQLAFNIHNNKRLMINNNTTILNNINNKDNVNNIIKLDHSEQNDLSGYASYGYNYIVSNCNGC